MLAYIVSYLELTGKLAGKEDESVLPMSLVDGPPIALLLTALVQLPGGEESERHVSME